MSLDLSSLSNAVASLERATGVAEKFIKNGGFSKAEIEVVKCGVIQNFEFTYELCWKFVKRWLEANFSENSTVGLTRKQLFRLAAENLLIEDVERWLAYHELRNRTSHAYDELIAAEIYDSAGRFLADARRLLSALEARND